nr:hypothetical protein [Streptococcus lutetiensis]
MLIGAMLSGFWYSIVVTCVFSDVSTNVSPQLIGNATTLILIFCNLGGASAAIVLNLFSKFSPQPGFAFVIYAIISLVICLGLIIKTRFQRKSLWLSLQTVQTLTIGLFLTNQSLQSMKFQKMY